MALATSETTVAGRFVVIINMPASIFDQRELSIIDVKLSQCIKIWLVSLHCKTVRLAERRARLAPKTRARDLRAYGASTFSRPADRRGHPQPRQGARVGRAAGGAIRGGRRRRGGAFGARGDRANVRGQRPGEGARGGRVVRPGGAGRRFGAVGAGAGRRAGGLFGEMGRPVEGLRPCDAPRRAAARRERERRYRG